jgi:hypothetical protein
MKARLWLKANAGRAQFVMKLLSGTASNAPKKFPLMAFAIAAFAPLARVMLVGKGHGATCACGLVNEAVFT